MMTHRATAIPCPIFTMGYIVVFDIGDSDSFQEAGKQLADLAADDETLGMVLVGNKTDKSRRYRKVLYEEGLELSQQHKARAAAYASNELNLLTLARGRMFPTSRPPPS